MKFKISLYLWIFMTFLMSGALTSCTDKETDEEILYPGLDKFEGRINKLVLTLETEHFSGDSCSIALLAPDNTVITRECLHRRASGESTFTMSSGLREGDYRLLYILYRVPGELRAEHTAPSRTADWKQFGLGGMISVGSDRITVKSNYDPRMEMEGSGTEEDPYIISSYDHLMTLAHKVNSDLTNELITTSTHFRQVVDIDMDDASFFCDHRYGWEPIGNDCNRPFRGIYHGRRLTRLWSLRDHSPAVGLFGYIHQASIDGVTAEDCELSGNFAVGTIAGAAITAGGSRDRSQITNCRVVNSSVEGSAGSLAIGGILGVADMHSKIMLYQCSNENTSVSGDYNVGGIMGASSAYTISSVNNCTNSGKIRSGYSGAGGIIGSSDTIYVTSCSNLGEITGGTAYRRGDTGNAATGTGGIAGGSGVAFITGCTNSARIKGIDGVGGLLGSCRVAGDDKSGLIYNNAAFRYCTNTADVEGERFVGGINGESQFGSFGVINSGNVSGDTYVGGIAGNTSISVAHNAINMGNVTGSNYVAGIVGKTTFGSLALDDNYGTVNATGSHTGGILALGGNNTIIHYCGNHGNIINTSGKFVGGIVGEIGDPREWTGWNIAECVIGAAEIVMSVVGPCISITEHLVEESVHALAFVLKYSEFSFDMLLHATDIVLWGDGVVDLASGETPEEVSTAIKVITMDLANDINREMQIIRTSADSYAPGSVSPLPLNNGRGKYETSNVSWYATEGNDEIFNDAINETRLERMEAEEKAEKVKAIVHQCIGGVCLIAGTVATIGATVATGGTATAFMAAGVLVGIVGGVNAIVKTCTEFECNAVVISQCVNSGKLQGSSSSGTIAGSLQDSGIMRDCLNVGDGTGSEKSLAGHFGTRAGAQRCLNAGKNLEGHDIGSCSDASGAFRKDGAGNHGNPYELNGSVILIDGGALRDISLYPKADSSWDITSSPVSRWTLVSDTDSGIIYPVPSYSEMRK